MTRKEIYNTYKIKDGIIESPGKFEAEYCWVPYYWDIYLCGLADEDRDGEITFIVNNVDRIQFPELKHTKEVHLWTDFQGLVYSEALEEGVSK